MKYRGILPKDTNCGVVLRFLRRDSSRNAHMWTDGRVLESYRTEIGRWEPGRRYPVIRDLSGAGDVRRGTRRGHQLYEELARALCQPN